MTVKKTSQVRVAMAKRVADKWLQKNALPEYRLTVYTGWESMRNLSGLLHAFRDRKTRIGSIEPIEDLGMDVTPDRLTLWSRNREGMLALDKWLTERGCETTGLW
jgi:hypothetical protein